MDKGIRLTLTDTAANAELTRLARAATDMAPAYNSIGAYLVFSTQRRFETESGPDGRKWTPLSPAHGQQADRPAPARLRAHPAPVDPALPLDHL